MLRANQAIPAQRVLVVEELEGVAAAINDVHHQRPTALVVVEAQTPPTASARLFDLIDRVQPQQALAVLAVAFLGAAFVFGDLGAFEENLVDDAQDAAPLGQDSQAVEAVEALTRAIADLAKLLLQGVQLREVQVAAVVD